LHTAAFHEYEQLVSLLIENGADVNVKTNKRRYTPLHIAACEGCVRVAELLLAGGAEVNAKSADGDTPLARAVCRHHKDVAGILREHGGVE
jgi:ankyrin repeat protein